VGSFPRSRSGLAQLGRWLTFFCCFKITVPVHSLDINNIDFRKVNQLPRPYPIYFRSANPHQCESMYVEVVTGNWIGFFSFSVMLLFPWMTTTLLVCFGSWTAIQVCRRNGIDIMQVMQLVVGRINIFFFTLWLEICILMHI
jgi:hypothetical protein